MTYSDTYEAIIEHLKTFPDLPLDNVQVGNMPVDGEGAFVIPDTDVWARMTVNYGQTFISGLADNPVTRRVGVLSFQLFGERGYGEYPLLDLAEKLTQHFQFHRVSFLEFLTGSTANISASGGLLNSSNDVSSGEWHQVNVNFTFRVYTNGAKNTPTPPPPPPPPPVEPPVLLSKVVSTNGLSVVLTFDKVITVNNLILDLSVNGATRTYTHTVNGAVLTITPSSVIYQSETVSIAYAGGIEDLEPFTMNAVNNSSVVKPVSDAALAAFGVNDKGVYYDFDDFTMLYQDTTLTNNINAVGQTIAGFKDKSGKGWNCLIPTVSRQPKVGQDAITGARYMMFDRSDDQINQLIGMNFDVSQGLTMIIAADYKTASTTANLNISLIQQASSWGFAIKGANSAVRSGVSTIVTDTSADRNWNIGTPLRGIVSSTPTKDCYIMRYNKNTGVKLSANNDYFSEITAADSTDWVLTNFSMQYTNKNVYKILIINRVLTDAECEAIRYQFNAAMGV